MDTNAALEYQTFKIPYEALNKQFREAQKNLARQRCRVSEPAKILRETLKGEKPIPIAEIAAPLAEFKERVAVMESMIDQVCEEQHDSLSDMAQRAQYLHTGVDGSLTEMEQWMWDKERVDRLVLQHLLRCGHLETAKALAEKTGLTRICDVSIFDKAYQVAKALRAGNTAPCHEWIHEHRSRLRRISSQLENEVRIQDAIELVRQDRRIEALKYVRKFLTQPLREGSERVRKLMIAIACGVDSATFKELGGTERWEELARIFNYENACLYQLPEQSVFSACLQAGICAHKTPLCSPNGNPHCAACDTTVHALATDLPFAHVGNSRLVCSLTGEILDEKNVPMMLTSGRVFGERAISQLREGDFVRCPTTGVLTHIKEVMRLYIM